jgi:hypothetical protein
MIYFDLPSDFSALATPIKGPDLAISLREINSA